jgi:hypothetical protein
VERATPPGGWRVVAVEDSVGTPRLYGLSPAGHAVVEVLPLEGRTPPDVAGYVVGSLIVGDS